MNNTPIEKHLNFLILNWNSTKTMISTEVPEVRRWYEIWKLNPSEKKKASAIIQYLLEAVDDFIKLMIKDTPKETPLDTKPIIDATSQLYDSTITLPLWAKLFGGTIKNLVINVMVPILIQFLCAKYNIPIAKESNV